MNLSLIHIFLSLALNRCFYAFGNLASAKCLDCFKSEFESHAHSARSYYVPVFYPFTRAGHQRRSRRAGTVPGLFDRCGPQRGHRLRQSGPPPFILHLVRPLQGDGARRLREKGGVQFYGWAASFHNWLNNPPTLPLNPINPDNARILRITAVSYTHLDVYKRQIYNQFLTHINVYILNNLYNNKLNK